MHLLGRVLLLMSPAALHLDQNDECKVGLAVQSVGRNAPAFPILSLPDMTGTRNFRVHVRREVHW